MDQHLWSTLERLRELAKLDFDKNCHEPFIAEILSIYLQYRPEDAYAWFMYGEALRVMGRLSESRPALMGALQKAESDIKPLIWTRLGMLYSARGHRMKAERWFSRVGNSKYSSDLDWFWVLRGANLAEIGDFEKAEACHHRAIQINDQNSEAYLNLGLVLRAQRKYSESLAALRVSHALDPTVRDTMQALESLANIDEAIDLLKNLDV